MEEEWRVIEVYENYSVSNKGNVRNDKTEKILSTQLHKDGYLRVGLIRDRKRKHYLIHRLVAIAFLENPDNLEQIDHINRIPDDNRVKNLRWCSNSNNQRNKKRKEGTTSKYQGVYFCKQNNKWRAQININKKNIYLGIFDTEEDAYEAWRTCVFENNLQDFYGL